jgi:hypothetical protein
MLEAFCSLSLMLNIVLVVEVARLRGEVRGLSALLSPGQKTVVSS